MCKNTWDPSVEYSRCCACCAVRFFCCYGEAAIESYRKALELDPSLHVCCFCGPTKEWHRFKWLRRLVSPLPLCPSFPSCPFRRRRPLSVRPVMLVPSSPWSSPVRPSVPWRVVVRPLFVRPVVRPIVVVRPPSVRPSRCPYVVNCYICRVSYVKFNKLGRTQSCIVSIG